MSFWFSKAIRKSFLRSSPEEHSVNKLCFLSLIYWILSAFAAAFATLASRIFCLLSSVFLSLSSWYCLRATFWTSFLSKAFLILPSIILTVVWLALASLEASKAFLSSSALISFCSIWSLVICGCGFWNLKQMYFSGSFEDSTSSQFFSSWD